MLELSTGLGQLIAQISDPGVVDREVLEVEGHDRATIRLHRFSIRGTQTQDTSSREPAVLHLNGGG